MERIIFIIHIRRFFFLKGESRPFLAGVLGGKLKMYENTYRIRIQKKRTLYIVDHKLFLIPENRSMRLGF